MKKVLVVSYYAPPLGMSGVMRVTKLAKYLPKFGWQPYILTTKPIAYYHYDYDLLNDLKNIQIFRSESFDLVRISHLLRIPKRTIKKGTGKLSMLTNFLFFPDAKASWIPFAYKLGSKIIEKEKPDVIFATAPPFSALKIGLKLKQHFNIPLVSDFRDPWPTGFVEPPTFIKKRIVKLREQIIKDSNCVVAVNRETAIKVNHPDIEIIENGYDPEEFKIAPYSLSGFCIVYTGNIWENFNDLKFVIEAVSDIHSVKIILVGSCDTRTLSKIKKYKHVEYFGIRPHSETIAIMKGASLLLYLSKPNQAVGLKLYEYFGAGKPILGVCNECNEAMRLIENRKAGLSIPCEKAEIKQSVLNLQANKFPYSPINLERYNRINQAEHLSKIFNSLVR